MAMLVVARCGAIASPNTGFALSCAFCNTVNVLRGFYSRFKRTHTYTLVLIHIYTHQFQRSCMCAAVASRGTIHNNPRLSLSHTAAENDSVEAVTSGMGSPLPYVNFSILAQVLVGFFFRHHTM